MNSGRRLNKMRPKRDLWTENIVIYNACMSNSAWFKYGSKKKNYLQQRTRSLDNYIQLGQIQHVNNGNVKILGQVMVDNRWTIGQNIMTSRTVITQGDRHLLVTHNILRYYIILKIIVHGCIDLQHVLSLDYCNL